MNVVAVFGGGGAKAAAQVGAHRALIESGLQPREYIGTSLGGVVAACFAAGMDPDTILRKIHGITREEVAIPRRFLAVRGLFVRSLLRPRPLRDAFERLIEARTFDELTFPLTVTAVDLDTGELVLFGRRGRKVGLIDALMATTALPLYYPPVRIGGREYLDGGLRAVLPLEVAVGIDADVVAAVNVGPGSDET
ncbi:MAG: patatin-like phospholipase family protein, partial [Gemmatimonadales bacterium]